MPQRDTSEVNRDSGADPLLNMTLWPNRSLEKKSFYILIIMTLSAMMIPIIPFLGTNFLLVILPFSLVTVLLLFLSIALNYETGKLYENVKIWPDLIEVKRYERNGVLKHWKANPYWIKVTLYEEDQKIQNYLTLTGSGREVEIGSFLAPSERLEIKQKIDMVIKQMQ